jgi:hypothetical protein
MIIGDMKKFLSCLVALKEDPPASGNIDNISKEYLAGLGCNITKVS